jgi:hypothetical protein
MRQRRVELRRGNKESRSHMMKSKRSGYLSKVTQGNKKNPKVSPMPAPAELSEDKKSEQHENCNGICSIAWKPALAAR